jgi:hypothetical protein
MALSRVERVQTTDGPSEEFLQRHLPVREQGPVGP